MSGLKRISHAIEYGGVRVAFAIAGMFPIGPSRAFGAALGWLAYTVFRIRRSVAIENVIRSLDVDEVAARAIVKRSYENLGRSLMEFVALRRMTLADAQQIFRMEGAEHMAEARSAGRGLVFVSGHQGSWEYLMVGFVTNDVPTSFLVGEQSNRRVDDLMNEVRARFGVELITKGMALKNVLRALRENRLVGMLADQDAGRNGVFVDFLGRPASTARGPALFAIRQRCPMVCGFVHRGRQGVLVAECTPPIWPDPDLDEEASVRDLTQRCTSALADAIRGHPDEYFWAHRRWKTKEL